MKIHKSFKIILGILFVAVFVVFFAKAQNSQAASGPTLTISPIDFKFSLDPGKTQTDQISLTNNGDTKLSVQSAVQDFLQQDENGTPGFISTTSEQTTLAKWITVSSPDFTLDSKETKTVSFTIAVPQTGEPGGHYAAVFFKTVPPQAIGNTQIGLSNQIGALVLVQVSGNITKTGKIVEIQSSKFVNHGPVDFVVRFENTGNSHYETQGDLKVYNWFGKNTEELSLPTHIVLPSSVRKFATTLNQKWLIGKYTVKAEIKDGDGNLQTNEITFWAFPWQEALIVLGAIILLIVIIIGVRRKFKVVKADSQNKKPEKKPTTSIKVESETKKTEKPASKTVKKVEDKAEVKPSAEEDKKPVAKIVEKPAAKTKSEPKAKAEPEVKKEESKPEAKSKDLEVKKAELEVKKAELELKKAEQSAPKKKKK